MSNSKVVQGALREAAALRRARSSLAEEVRRLIADDKDRHQMRLIRRQMAGLAPASLD